MSKELKFVDPFEDVDGIVFEHICVRCGNKFGSPVAAHTVRAFEVHNCSSTWCEECGLYHATGVNKVSMFAVNVGSVNWRLCRDHAVSFWDEHITDYPLLSISGIDSVCPADCSDCDTNKKGEK